jgi:O-succinylhomoserine sulfhydrylase
MRAHSQHAAELAVWLQEQPCVEKVHFPGVQNHPQHELAKRQQLDYGGVLSFEIKGGKEQAWKVIDATELISITANLGDAKSTITHPATTTHGRLTPEAREEAGISDGLIRIAVGLEDIEDLKRDLSRGFRLLA